MAKESIAEKTDKLVELELARGSIIPEGDEQTQIIDYLTDEVTTVESGTERAEMLEQVARWRRQREARPEQEQKDFPWPGASNIVPPLSMTNTNALFAMVKESLGARRPFWTVGTDDDALQSHAKALELLLDAMAESRYHMNLREANNQIFYDMVSLGTQFVKVPWTVERWFFKRPNSQSGALEQVSKVVKDCPEVVPIRFEDFVTRPFWPDPQRAPWVGNRVWYMKHELQQRQSQGIFNDLVEKVIQRGTDDLDDNRIEELRRMGIYPDETSDTNLFGVYEINCFWDVDGDGFPEDVILWFDPVTGSVLRSEYNDLGIRPYVRLPYFERPNELYAMGVGWMTDQLQDAFTALMNMYINGTMLAMLQMYVSRRGSGVAPNETFRPLKNIIVDNPKEDFLPIKFPDLGYGNLQAQLMIKEMADRATGASDAMLGFESKATSARTTASGTMFLAQQGSRLFNAIRSGIDHAYGQIGQIATFQLVRNRERAEQLFGLVPPENQQALQELLEMNVEDIPTAFKFKVNTTEIEKTDEARKQARLTLVQLYTMYGEKIFQMLPMVYAPQNQVPPQIQEVATKFFIGSTKMMEDIFKDFGEMQPNEYLPFIKDIEMMVNAIEAQKSQMVAQVGGRTGGVPQNSPEMGPPAGGGPGPGGAGPQQGLAPNPTVP